MGARKKEACPINKSMTRLKKSVTLRINTTDEHSGDAVGANVSENAGDGGNGIVL
ncbi:MAG: hypothetical protein LUD12_15425 [Lachnospiraceae bacterium]|nr:hypothetical protein [Lachnospiraceae bacterium]